MSIKDELENVADFIEDNGKTISVSLAALASISRYLTSAIEVLATKGLSEEDRKELAAVYKASRDTAISKMDQDIANQKAREESKSDEE